MDIGEYSPKSTLVVDENKIYRSKFPFIDVHSHHWDMPIQDLSTLVSEMDSLNMAYLINPVSYTHLTLPTKRIV